MTGIELFNIEAKKRNFNIGPTDVTLGDTNGDFLITDTYGKSTKQNYKKIADVWGNLVFYHFSPEDAMNEVFELIELQIKQSS